MSKELKFTITVEVPESIAEDTSILDDISAVVKSKIQEKLVTFYANKTSVGMQILTIPEAA